MGFESFNRKWITWRPRYGRVQSVRTSQTFSPMVWSWAKPTICVAISHPLVVGLMVKIMSLSWRRWVEELEIGCLLMGWLVGWFKPISSQFNSIQFKLTLFLFGYISPTILTILTILTCALPIYQHTHNCVFTLLLILLFPSPLVVNHWSSMKDARGNSAG